MCETITTLTKSLTFLSLSSLSLSLKGGLDKERRLYRWTNLRNVYCTSYLVISTKQRSFFKFWYSCHSKSAPSKRPSCTDSSLSANEFFKWLLRPLEVSVTLRAREKENYQAVVYGTQVPAVSGEACQWSEYSPSKQALTFPSPGLDCCALEVLGLPRTPSGSRSSR